MSKPDLSNAAVTLHILFSVGLPVGSKAHLLTHALFKRHSVLGVFSAGLPRLLVDVRHEASHNDMPSLSLLRLAAAQALDWLQAAYWQRQEAYLQQQKDRVVQLLQVWIPETMHLVLEHPGLPNFGFNALWQLYACA